MRADQQPTEVPELRLVTERLVLRPPVRGDVPAIVEGIGDFAVSRNLTRVPHPYGPMDAETWLAIVARNPNDGGVSLAITRDGGELMGVVGFTTMLGYWLARRYWGQGFATEAARALLGHLFDDKGVASVRSGVLADNPASLRVQGKLGFRRVGTSRVFSLARQAEVDHIDTLLERERFLELNR